MSQTLRAEFATKNEKYIIKQLLRNKHISL